jgi:CHAD domain-containing protein
MPLPKTSPYEFPLHLSSDRVGHLASSRPLVAEPTVAPPSTGLDAAGSLRALLDDQVAAVQAADGRLRTNGQAGIHRMRVALRRLRSTLTTFRPFLDQSSEGLRSELRWFASELSPARDAEVLRARFAAACAEDPLLGPDALADLDPFLQLEDRTATAHAESAWASDRYSHLAGSLVRLFASELITLDPGVSVQQAFVPLVADELRRVRRRADQVDGNGDRDELVHELRKATKRARYTSEVLLPLDRKRAAKLGRRLERLQILLGDRQDSTVARGFLEELLRDAELEPRATESVERLLARERAVTAGLDERLPAAILKATRPGRLLPL